MKLKIIFRNIPSSYVAIKQKSLSEPLNFGNIKQKIYSEENLKGLRYVLKLMMH